MNKNRNKYLILFAYAVLAAAIVIAYEPMRNNDFISYDDGSYVTDNPHVNKGLSRESVIWAFTNPHFGMWHPVTSISHMLDCELFDLKPFWHHFTSFLIHMFSTLLLFYILNSMTSVFWPSFFVALIFAVHPLNVESVAWVAERKNILSCFFWMLTITAYISYVKRPGVLRYFLVIFAFCLGLLSKPMMVTLPFVLLLLDYWPLCRFQGLKSLHNENFSKAESPKLKYRQFSCWYLIGEKVPLFVLSIILCVITFLSQRNIGAMVQAETLPFKLRVANVFISYVSYLGKLFYPNHLAVFYPHAGSRLILWQPIVSFFILAVISVLILYEGYKKHYLTVGWLWFLGTLVPVIGLVQVGSQAIADRYTYIPSIGIYIIFAWWFTEFLRKKPKAKVFFIILAGLVFVVLLFCTRKQVQRWKNDLTLFEYVLSVTENNAIIHNSYAHALFEDGQAEESVLHLKKALEISPGFSLARNNLGRVYFKQGKIGAAITCFKMALPGSTKQPEIYHYLGRSKIKQKKPFEAIEYFNESLRLDPSYIKSRIYLAYTLFEVNKIQSAVEQYYKVLEYEPDNLEALNSLAWFLATKVDASFYDPQKAVEYAQRACELTDYENPELLDTLAVSYAASGNFKEAIEKATKAIGLIDLDDKKELADEIQKHLELYKAGKPYRED